MCVSECVCVRGHVMKSVWVPCFSCLSVSGQVADILTDIIGP